MQELNMVEVDGIGGGTIKTGGQLFAAGVLAFGAGLTGALLGGPGGAVAGATIAWKYMEAITPN